MSVENEPSATVGAFLRGFRPAVVGAVGWSVSAGAAALAVALREYRPAWVQILAWTVSWLLPLVLLRRRDLRRPRLPGEERGVTFGEVAAVGALLAVAVALRSGNLDGLPERLHNDEMQCGLEGLTFLGPNPPGVFDVGWYSCPRLAFFLISPFLGVFGRGLLGLRLFAVFFGLVSLAATWALVRSLLGPRTAILLLALDTVYPWHIHLSRTGFIYILAPAAIPLVLLAFQRGIRTERLLPFGAAGVLLGIAVQTYYATWMLAPLLASVTAVLAVANRSGRAARLRGLVVTAALSVVTAAPLLSDYAGRPAALTERSAEVFVFGSEAHTHVEGLVRSSHASRVLAYQVRRIFEGLFQGHDTSVQFGVNTPLVPGPLQIPFAAGVLLACWRWRRTGPALLLLWVGGTLISGGILTIDPPFTPRLSGISVVLLVFCAIAFDALLELASVAAWPALRLVLTGSVALWCAASMLNELRTWQVLYPAATAGGPRDVIPRVLRDHPEVPVGVFLGPGVEELEYQSFTFLSPGTRLLNASEPNARARETASRALAKGRSVLLFEASTPSTDPLLQDLLGRGARVREEGRSSGGVHWWIVDPWSR